jgi:hypothetical protein
VKEAMSEFFENDKQELYNKLQLEQTSDKLNSRPTKEVKPVEVCFGKLIEAIQ